MYYAVKAPLGTKGGQRTLERVRFHEHISRALYDVFYTQFFA